MEFENRKSGDTQYIVCKAPQECEVDTITRGMLLNNRIEGTAPVEITEIDGMEEYRFDVTGLSLIRDIYEKHIRKQGLLTVLLSITETIIRCRDYMIPETAFVLSEDFIYVTPSNCQTTLLVLPARQEEQYDLKTLLTGILTGCRTDSREPTNYIHYLLDFLKEDDLTTDSICKMLSGLARNEISIPPKYSMAGKEMSRKGHEKVHGSVLFQGGGGFHERTAAIAPIPFDSGNDSVKTLPPAGHDIIKPLSSVLKAGQDQNPASAGIRPLSEIMRLKAREEIRIAEKDMTEQLSEDRGYKNETALEMEPAEEEEYEETGLLIDEYTEELRPVPALKRGYLIRISNEERIEIRGREFVIGRSEEQADYAVPENRWISNMHASIITTRDGCYLRDLGSMNHTYLNDTQIYGKTEVLIQDNSVIRLGNERFQFRYH